VLLEFLEDGIEDEFRRERGLGRLQTGERAEFLVLPQREGTLEEVPIACSLGCNLGGRPELDEVLVEGAEQVECELSRERDFTLRDDEPESRRPRENAIECLLVEGVVDDRAFRDGGSGYTEQVRAAS